MLDNNTADQVRLETLQEQSFWSLESDLMCERAVVIVVPPFSISGQKIMRSINLGAAAESGIIWWHLADFGAIPDAVAAGSQLSGWISPTRRPTTVRHQPESSSTYGHS